MQIEFYLPLPSEGFWAALIIYYMIGLFVFLYQSLKNYDRRAHEKAFSATHSVVGCLCIAIIVAGWPYYLALYHRNR